MKYQIIIVFLSITNSVFSKYSKHLGYWDGENDSGMDFGWLLDKDDPENNEVEPKKPKVCKTNDCEILGKEFLKGMNESVNPCDNFYDFVCGAWKSNYKIPGYSPVWSRPQMFQQTAFRRIKEILEIKPKRSEILPVKQAKKWYRACMNIDALESRGIKPLESILMQLGGWPMTIDAEEWDENGHSWQRIEQHYFHLTGSYIFIDITPSPWNDGLKVQSGKLPLFSKLPFKYRNYTANKYDEYVELIENIVRMFIEHNSANVTEEMLKKDVADLVNFEKELYKIDHLDDDDETINRDYETINEFIEGYEDALDSKLETGTLKINFRKIIKSKFDLINMDVNGSLSIRAKGYSYYTNLTELIQNTPKRIIVNYLHWFFVSDMLVYTTERMRNHFFKYMENEFGVTEREPRWLECTTEVKMKIAESYAFVKKYFSKDVEQTARKMFENIRKEMKSQVSSSNWMDQETKDIAIEKLDSMKVFIGFPDWFKNKTRVLHYYKGLIIGNDHFDNVLSFGKYRIKQNWHELFSESASDRYYIDALVVNAFYALGMNFIELPAADFQPPLFTPQLPSVVNYGLIGSAIGHEIGHGFDVNGIHYGKGENLTEISKQIMEMYYKRAECFLDQFNNYYGVTEADYEDTTPDYFSGSRGRFTRAENMADTTGLHSVVKAYQNMRAKNPDVVSKLPGLEKYTDDQMFFISFGALWCEKSTPEYDKIRAKKDSHSPGPLRAIGAVSNTNDFAKAFNCPKGSPMNPENKCNIWKYKSSKNSEKVENNSDHPWVFGW